MIISTMESSISLAGFRTRTKERWDDILRSKREFLINGIDPGNCPFIDPEIAESWVRSRNNGVNPYTQIFEIPIKSSEFEEVLQQNSLLIDITRPIIDSFREYAISRGYSAYLCDKNGVLLLHEGETMIGPPGSVWNETTSGTTAHGLSMRLKRPIQLLGPEHYIEYLSDVVASAAPILDEDGEVLAAIILCQPLIDPPWEESVQVLYSHTLGLITALAILVGDKLQLKKSYHQLSMANDRLTAANAQLEMLNSNLRTAYEILNATLAIIDEGIVTIDQSGKIININREASRILNMKPEDTGKKNIAEYLESDSRLLTLVACGERTDVEETICNGNNEQPYLVNICPAIIRGTNQVLGAVLKLNHSERINAMVASRSGATATFSFEDIIGESKAIKDAIALARRFANSQENILLSGESGTGKELFAQAIHNQYRPHGPFIAINCAAMPRELIESELFGYEGGSFTGAERSGRPGKIELANGGTLFLDEIGDMPFELQAVLLRVLQDKQVMRVGGRRYKKVNFRVIAATNKDLYQMVKARLFREDLYFRFSVLSIKLPPLRERGNDIQILERFFIESYCKKLGLQIPQISPAAQKKINEYSWPGNVRQLENAMIYAVNTALGNVIEVNNLPDDIIMDNNPPGPDEARFSDGKMGYGLSLRDWERKAVETALENTHNNVPMAAELLKISKTTLYRKLREFNIDY